MDTSASDKLVLALDVDDLDTASALAQTLAGYFRVAKIGLELYTTAGPDAVKTIAGLGYDIFCDLKLHDIPNTVRRAAAAAGKLKVSYLTVHACGGVEMLAAAVEGLAEGSDGSAGVLAVTVLTSDASAADTRDLVAERMRMAFDAGCVGVVCAAPDLDASRRVCPWLIRAVPGVRLPGDSADDQRRVASPAQALASGADLLVVGRPVTRAEDPVAAAQRLHRHVTLQQADAAGGPKSSGVR